MMSAIANAPSFPRPFMARFTSFSRVLPCNHTNNRKVINKTLKAIFHPCGTIKDTINP